MNCQPFRVKEVTIHVCQTLHTGITLRNTLNLQYKFYAEKRAVINIEELQLSYDTSILITAHINIYNIIV